MKCKMGFCKGIFILVLVMLYCRPNCVAFNSDNSDLTGHPEHNNDSIDDSYCSAGFDLENNVLDDQLILNYIDSLFSLDDVPPALVEQINLFISIKGKSDNEIFALIDSLFELDKVPYLMINQINYYVATRIDADEDFNLGNIAITAFYDNSLYPANCFYESWDTKNANPYTDELWRADSSMILVLQDSANYCNYVHPFNGPVTSNFGWRDGRNHNGIDIDLWTGAPVVAAFDGMVRVARNQGGYGNVVVVRHYNGLETLYAHLHKIKVKPGQVISAGQVIGLGGNTGKSTGSHLHFEIRFKGKPINPRHLVSFKEKQLHSDTFVFTKNKFSYSAFPEGTEFHTVQKGDYLFAISEKYGLTVKKLCELNGLSKKTSLRVGQNLRIN